MLHDQIHFHFPNEYYACGTGSKQLRSYSVCLASSWTIFSLNELSLAQMHSFRPMKLCGLHPWRYPKRDKTRSNTLWLYSQLQNWTKQYPEMSPDLIFSMILYKILVGSYTFERQHHQLYLFNGELVFTAVFLHAWFQILPLIQLSRYRFLTPQKIWS